MLIAMMSSNSRRGTYRDRRAWQVCFDFPSSNLLFELDDVTARLACILYYFNLIQRFIHVVTIRFMLPKQQSSDNWKTLHTGAIVRKN